MAARSCQTRRVLCKDQENTFAGATRTKVSGCVSEQSGQDCHLRNTVALTRIDPSANGTGVYFIFCYNNHLKTKVEMLKINK